MSVKGKIRASMLKKFYTNIWNNNNKKNKSLEVVGRKEYLGFAFDKKNCLNNCLKD